MILRHNAHAKTINILEISDGLDFQYKRKSHAHSLLHFIENNFIARSKHSQQLVSHDPRANTAIQKYTAICELAPICRDDLVILPKKLCKDLGGIGPLVLVYKVT